MYTKTPRVLEVRASSAAIVLTPAGSCTSFVAKSCAIAAHACRRHAGCADASLCRAHVEDFRGCCAAECQPEYPARVGTSLRISAAATVPRQASSLHPRRGRRAARRPPGGPVDLL